MSGRSKKGILQKALLGDQDEVSFANLGEGNSKRNKRMDTSAAVSSTAANAPSATSKPKCNTSPKIRLPTPKPTNKVNTFKPMDCPGRFPPSEVTIPPKSGCVMS